MDYKMSKKEEYEYKENLKKYINDELNIMSLEKLRETFKNIIKNREPSEFVISRTNFIKKVK